MFISGVPLLLPELKWLLIGERLGSGDYTMYQDVWDYTAPFSVFVYKWIAIIFGKSRVPYFVLSFILVVIQAGIFNHVMLRNKAYNSSTYVPALVYMLFMNAFFDFMTLSPVLLSMTFVLLAMNNLFMRMDNMTKDELFIFTGVYLGIATLFYLPSLWFFIITMISLIIYTGSILRRMLLLIYGFAMVCILASLFFYWFDDFLIAFHHVFQSLWKIEATMYLDWTELLLVSIVPSTLFLFAVYKVKKLGKYINFQEKIQQVMLMFFVSGFLALMLSREISSYQLIYFVPTVAFFVSHFLLLSRHWLIAELNLGIVIILLIMNHLIFANQWFHVDEFVDYAPLTVQENKYNKITEGKKLLVLGKDMSYYQNASLATPYLNWDLSQIQLSNLNYYDNSAEVFVNFNEGLPEVIIDQKQILPVLFDMMPTIASQYIHHEAYPEIYLLKE